MTSGGARYRSGPPADPRSGRSERRGLSDGMERLPAEGRSGLPPLEWPLTAAQVYIDVVVNGKPTKELDEDATQERRADELALWAEVWSYPQAVVWERERWRWNDVALYVRTFLVAAGPEAKSSDKAALHKVADKIGLSPQGLLLNKWEICRDEVAVKRAEAAPAEPSTGKRERRLRAVKDGSG